MESQTPGCKATIQALSESEQEVEMIFPMAGESFTADTGIIDPPQAFVSPSDPRNANFVEHQGPQTPGTKCPVVESMAEVCRTADKGGLKGQHSQVASASVVVSDNTDMVRKNSTLSSRDITEADSSDNPFNNSDEGKEDKEVDRGKNLCQTHPDETVTTYCQSCNRLVCLECLVEDDTHGSHKKISIKKLLATPEFFSKMREGLSKLLLNKEQYVDNLKQAAADIEIGHENQIKVIRDLEKRALEQLERGLEAETKKLIAAGEKQEEQIKVVARSAVEAIEKHMEDQTSAVVVEREKVETTLPTLSDLTATMKKVPSSEVLHDLVIGYRRSKQILKNLSEDFVVTGVESQAQEVDGKGMEKFTKLKVKVVDVAANAADQTQTETIGPTTVLSVEGLRRRIGAIVSNCVADYSQESPKPSAVISKDYFTISCNFGLHSSAVLPGCYQEPDFTKPVDMYNDLQFIDPSNAKSLGSLLGGKPSLTVHQVNTHWFLKDHEGGVVSYLVWMHDEKGQQLIAKTAEGKRRSASVFLPAPSNLYGALESYLGWRPSEVKFKQSKRTVDPMITVLRWGSTTSSCKLIVIE